MLNDKAMAAAGHPVGADFDAGRDLGVQKMVHWPSGTVGEARARGYDKAFYASVTSAGRPTAASSAAAAGGGKPARRRSLPPRDPPPGAGRRPRSGREGAARPAPRPPRRAATNTRTWGTTSSWTRGPTRPPPEPRTAGTRRPRAPSAAAARPRPSSGSCRLPDEPSGAFAAPPWSRAAAAPPAAAPRARQRGRCRRSRGTPHRPHAGGAARPRRGPPRGPDPPEEEAAPCRRPHLPRSSRGPDGELLHLQDAILALALETLRKSP